MEVTSGRGGLAKLDISTPWSSAEIYLQGAQVTHFQKHDEPPLLFLSTKSRYETNTPIRGGIPIIFPWFGKPPEKTIQHGFARNREWKLIAAEKAADGAVVVRFELPPCPALEDIRVEYLVTIRDALQAELIVTNRSTETFQFENCLHSYFKIGDITTASVTGLRGMSYLDALDGRRQKSEIHDAIRFTEEVDRIYVNAPNPTVIRDPGLQRAILIEKENSRSTVVWNPWVAKAKAMVDFGDDEYLRMVCVESGNAAANRLELAPDKTSTLKIKLSSRPLA